MIITHEEGLMHLIRWCKDAAPLMIQHITNNSSNSSMVMGEIDAIADGEILITIEDAPRNYVGRYRYEDAAWMYTEVEDIKNLSDIVKAMYPPQTPVLCLTWPESEVLMIQPRPEDWED